jgi:putative membrane protein
MASSRRSRTAGYMLVATLVAAGCAKKEDVDQGAVQDTAAAMAPQPAPAGPSDADIAHIVVTANTIDIDAGNVANEKSTNARVKAFGKQMVTDHTGVNTMASDLAGKLSLTPTDNATSQSLKSAADATKARLAGLSGAEFDRGYIDNEVAFHQQVLDAIDSTLLPNAQNAELKGLIEKVRPAIAGHLEMAKQIQAALTN